MVQRQCAGDLGRDCCRLALKQEYRSDEIGRCQQKGVLANHRMCIGLRPIEGLRRAEEEAGRGPEFTDDVEEEGDVHRHRDGVGCTGLETLEVESGAALRASDLQAHLQVASSI